VTTKRLSVNIDHSATVRQARLDTKPDPVEIATLAEEAGADGITAHLREDRRHVCDRDIMELRKSVKTELNMEMAATVEMLAIAVNVKPDLVTLVPEKREELTTEGGLYVEGLKEGLTKYVAELKKAGMRVNLFIEPSEGAIRASKKIGADGVELHTGIYANAKDNAEAEKEATRIKEAAVLASSLGLHVHAGHGLDYENIKPIAEINEIEEYAIGFSIMGRSMYVGIKEAVREMKELIGG